MFKIGQKLTKENYTQAALWCNQNGAMIQEVSAAYYISRCPIAPPLSLAQKVRALEVQYSLPRPVRTALLAARDQGAMLDGVLLARMEEVEGLAATWRAGEDA